MNDQQCNIIYTQNYEWAIMQYNIYHKTMNEQYNIYTTGEKSMWKQCKCNFISDHTYESNNCAQSWWCDKFIPLNKVHIYSWWPWGMNRCSVLSLFGRQCDRVFFRHLGCDSPGPTPRVWGRAAMYSLCMTNGGGLEDDDF